MRVRHGAGASAAFRRPLLGSSRAPRQFPFVAEQVLEEIVAPFRRRRGPDDFEAAANRVAAATAAVRASPAETLILDRATFRFGANKRRIARAVGLAEAVPPGDQRDRLLVVHGHAEKGLADVLGRRDRIRIAPGTFRVDVYQSHLNRAERLGKLAFATVTLVTQPGALGTPVKLFGFPYIDTSSGEAEGLEAHQFKRDIAGQHDQVGPGNLAAIFLLDGPQKPARLVEVHIVRPRIERRETLLTGAGAAATVSDAVSAGAMPGHADEQAAIVAEIGWPPFLGIGHQRLQIFDDSIEIELLEFRGVVESLTHRVGQIGVGMKNLDIQLPWPPVAIAVSAAIERAFARALVVGFRVHVSLPLKCFGMPPECRAHAVRH